MILLTPTLLVRIKIDYFDYAEHRGYLPLLGVFIIIIEIFKSFKIDFNKKSVLIVTTVILLAFAGRSYAYQSAFENGKEFWVTLLSSSEKMLWVISILQRYSFI